MVANASTDIWPMNTGQASGRMRRALPAQPLVGVMADRKAEFTPKIKPTVA